MKRYEIQTPEGFFNRGLKTGRRPGFKHSDEWRQRHSDRMSGKKNPFHGKRHSRMTRKKMSENHADFSGDKNPFSSSLMKPGRREAHSARCKALWNKRDEAYRARFGAKLSRIKAEKPMEDEKYHKNHVSGFMETQKAGRIFCRSSWESAVALVLNEREDVVTFALEPFCITYKDMNGIDRKTRIDFLIELRDGRRIMLEVKPESMRNHGTNPYKIQGYRDYCLKEGIWFALIGKECIDISFFDDVLKGMRDHVTL